MTDFQFGVLAGGLSFVAFLQLATLQNQYNTRSTMAKSRQELKSAIASLVEEVRSEREEAQAGLVNLDSKITALETKIAELGMEQDFEEEWTALTEARAGVQQIYDRPAPSVPEEVTESENDEGENADSENDAE